MSIVQPERPDSSLSISAASTRTTGRKTNIALSLSNNARRASKDSKSSSVLAGPIVSALSPSKYQKVDYVVLNQHRFNFQ